jgi:hypothetical protein
MGRCAPSAVAGTGPLRAVQGLGNPRYQSVTINSGNTKDQLGVVLLGFAGAVADGCAAPLQAIPLYRSLRRGRHRRCGCCGCNHVLLGPPLITWSEAYCTRCWRPASMSWTECRRHVAGMQQVHDRLLGPGGSSLWTRWSRQHEGEASSAATRRQLGCSLFQRLLQRQYARGVFHGLRCRGG